MICVYRIVCKENNKSYVGQTKNYRKRCQQHKTDLKRCRHSNKGLQLDYDKFGDSSFDYEVLEECTEETKGLREMYWVGFYATDNEEYGYNLTSGGIKNYKHCDRTKQKMSDASLGKPKSEEARRKMSEAKKGKEPHNKGVKYGEEVRKRMSEAKKGHIPWIKGKGHTEETKKKLSEMKKGKKLPPKTEETRRKLSESLKGNQNCKGRKLSEAHRQKLIESNKNRVWTEESKRKRTETRRRNMELKKKSE